LQAFLDAAQGGAVTRLEHLLAADALPPERDRKAA
jgi:hypothetical protein